MSPIQAPKSQPPATGAEILSKGAELGSWLLATLNQVVAEGEKARQEAQKEEIAREAREQAEQKKNQEAQQQQQLAERAQKLAEQQKESLAQEEMSEAAQKLSLLRNLNTGGINPAEIFGLKQRVLTDAREVFSTGAVDPNASPFAADPAEGLAAIETHEALFDARNELMLEPQSREEKREQAIDQSPAITLQPGDEILLTDPNLPGRFAVAPHPDNPKVFLAAGKMRLSDSPVKFYPEPDGSYRPDRPFTGIMDTARIVFPNGEVRFGGFEVAYGTDACVDIPRKAGQRGEGQELRTAA